MLLADADRDEMSEFRRVVVARPAGHRVSIEPLQEVVKREFSLVAECAVGRDGVSHSPLVGVELCVGAPQVEGNWSEPERANHHREHSPYQHAPHGFLRVRGD